jgi:hypothetical protein
MTLSPMVVARSFGWRSHSAFAEVHILRPIVSGRIALRTPFPKVSSPEDARWNAERQAVEFGGEIGEYRKVVRAYSLCGPGVPASSRAQTPLPHVDR